MAVAITHYETGTSGGSPLILSSSLGTTAQMWDPQLEALGTHHRVITYDHRGHGRSSIPPGPYTLAGIAGDVLDLMDDLSLDSVDFAGLSLGGMVGMWIAENAPSRIRRLALLCTYATVTDPTVWAERAALVRSEGTAPIVDASIERWFTPEFRGTHSDLADRFADSLRAMSAVGYASCCQAIESMTIDTRLEAIEAPTLVVAGRHDLGASPEMTRALASSIPNARYEEVEGAHLASVEQSARVSELLSNHFD